ncbi:DNA polymerase III tau subunit [Litorimonas taeanensis]|uniref:DNA polymerase III subunit gamma/tau n=1 Tax=Litorimonas taeanensis TaxID=568099 RepID=A0A420WDT0_9PROT|nr:DNA polymerase III subunit gamma/tau [Litorimonas taeanensis]RKQ69070.1 DNA polymerase III tau subunit [Litorimonas taeanensis]
MTTNSQQSYQVLARKYRPATFEDMIGQDAMVTTLTNAFEAGRVAHAFMMTGVRGIGKTTTARLLARALNYETDEINGPSTDLSVPGKHCEAIMASSHMDVLEMDAASRTGVENMREMLDGVRYAPATARYKVYIIDEVHMLSAGAFNALLKTLEEPPDHAKFIFATTEIRKVPITVLSRCQRFDLRRVEAGLLAAHLKGICAKENVKVSDEGLALIARAAEGSVRDSLSLLDQAIVQAGLDGNEVTFEQVRAMLGLADRVRVLDLFGMAALGDGKGAITEMRAQYDDGADPAVIMRDLMDICHEVSRAKTLGEGADFDAAPDQIERLTSLAERLSMGQLTRLWQILTQSHTEVRQAPAPLAAAEMAMLKLAVAGQMPPPELAAQIIEQAQHAAKEGGAGLPVLNAPTTSASPSAAQTRVTSGQTLLGNSPNGQVSHNAPSTGATAQLSAPKSVSVTPPSVEIDTLEQFVDLLPKAKVKLKSDIARYVRPIQFKRQNVRVEILDGAPNDLIGKMVGALQDLTGSPWLISPEKSGGAPTLAEARRKKKSDQKAKDRAHPAFNHPLLKGAELLGIKNRESSNVIQGDFRRSEALSADDARNDIDEYSIDEGVPSDYTPPEY